MRLLYAHTTGGYVSQVYKVQQVPGDNNRVSPIFFVVQVLTFSDKRKHCPSKPKDLGGGLKLFI